MPDRPSSPAHTDMFGAPWVADLEEAQAMGELQPRMRAGDKDRQRVVEQLGKHFGEGRLTIDLPREPEPHRRPTRSATRVPSGVFLVFLAMLLAWSMVAAVVYGAPPFFAVLLLFLFLRHRRWSRRW